MPAAGTTNPSPHAAARRATADDVQELRTRVSLLEKSAQELEESYATNKQLRSKVVQLETQLSTLGDTVQGLLEFKIRATKLLQVLVSNHDVGELKNQVLSLALQSNDPNAFLKSVVDGEQVSNEVGEDGQTQSENTHTGGEMDPEALQLQLRDSQPLKNVCTNVLLHLFGVIRELKPENILYPHGLTRNDPGWPGEGVGDQRRPFLRFDFTKPSDDPVNVEGFKEYCKFVRNRGAERVPAAAAVLQQATDATIQERCQLKYKYEANKYKQYLREQSQANPTPVDDQQGGNEGDGDVIQVPTQKKRKKTAYYRSRAESKLKARARKVSRMVVPYSIMELQTFLTPGAQSDDESEYETLPDGAKSKTGRYVTHGWSFMSERFKNLKSLVDATVDPEPPRGYLPREPGSPREGAPPANNCNQYLLRDWMIDPEVLIQHPEWHRRNLVISDDKPIETQAPTQANKRKQGSKTHQVGSAQLPDMKKARLDLSAAQEKLKEVLGGETLEELGLALSDALEGGSNLPGGPEEDEEEDPYD